MVEKSIASPWYIPFGIVAFTSIQGGLNYLATYLNTWVGGKISNGLKYDLFKKLLTFETSFYDKGAPAMWCFSLITMQILLVQDCLII